MQYSMATYLDRDSSSLEHLGGRYGHEEIQVPSDHGRRSLRDFNQRLKKDDGLVLLRRRGAAECARAGLQPGPVPHGQGG